MYLQSIFTHIKKYHVVYRGERGGFANFFFKIFYAVNFGPGASMDVLM